MHGTLLSSRLEDFDFWGRKTYRRTHARAHAHTHARAHTHTCTHIHAHTHTHIHRPASQRIQKLSRTMDCTLLSSRLEDCDFFHRLSLYWKAWLQIAQPTNVCSKWELVFASARLGVFKCRVLKWLANIYIRTYPCTYVLIHACMCMYVYIHRWLYAKIDVYINVHIYTPDTHMPQRGLYVYVCVYTQMIICKDWYLCKCTHIYTRDSHASHSVACRNMRVSKPIHIHTNEYTYTLICMWMYIPIVACRNMRVSKPIHIHTNEYTYTLIYMWMYIHID